MTVGSKYGILIATMVLIVWINSCSKDEVGLEPISQPPENTHQPTYYKPDLPGYFPVFSVPKDNPMTEEGIQFGRYLYYDPLLSTGGPLEGNSCSSCHLQQRSFSSPQSGISVLAHINLNYWPTFLWNGAVEGTLEDAMRFEVEDFFKSDIELIDQSERYSDLCFEAYGTREVTIKEVTYALAQFFRVLNSYQSKYDLSQQGSLSLSSREIQGMKIFNSEKGDCFHCHSVPLFTDHRFHNIGLDSIFDASNSGKYNVTGIDSDKGKFKSPTLRNIALTAPYMHDGRFQTLDEVIEHYNSGVKNSAYLDPIMTKPGKEHGLQLTEFEKANLKAFLLTLTDTSFTANPELSNPFQ